jgi:hypothetical protein
LWDDRNVEPRALNPVRHSALRMTVVVGTLALVLHARPLAAQSADDILTYRAPIARKG